MDVQKDLRFECQESCKGRCCSSSWVGGGGYVFLTKDDTAKLTRFLKKPLQEFADFGEFAYTRFSITPVKAWFLKMTLGTCRFFKDGKCGVYEARPVQCRTFPFWPENLKPEAWAKLPELCPGIGKGPNHSYKKVYEQIEADRELCNQNKPK